MKRHVIKWLRERVPPSRWDQFWFLTPITMIFLLPIGSGMVHILGMLGWEGAGRATQGLMILSVLGGPFVGILVLWCVDESGLNEPLISRTQLLARLAVVAPLLTLRVMFFIAGII